MGDHLKKRRLDLGLFQKEVASRLGVNEGTILNWERGKTLPPVRCVPRVIRFLGCDPYPAPTSLAEKLMAKRRQLGVSRKWLANRLGVDEGTLAHWEKGQREPAGKWVETVKAFLVDLRVGSGCPRRNDAPQRSILLRKVHREEHGKVPAEFMRWVWAGGRKLKAI